MKRLILLLAFTTVVGVTYTGHDSSVEKAAVQVCSQANDDNALLPVAVFTAEIPSEVIVFAPELGKRTPNKNLVSEKLAEGLFMSIRPPPESRPKIV